MKTKLDALMEALRGLEPGEPQRPLVEDGSPRANAKRSLAWALYDNADELLLLLEILLLAEGPPPEPPKLHLVPKKETLH